MLDVDRSKIISMIVYHQETFYYKAIHRGCLKYCCGNPMFIVDGAPWLMKALEDLI